MLNWASGPAAAALQTVLQACNCQYAQPCTRMMCLTPQQHTHLAPSPLHSPAAPGNSLFELTDAISRLSTKAGAAAIVQDSGKGNLTLATNGEATLYDGQGRALFTSGTANKGAAPYSLVLRASGELTVQDNAGKVLWNANTTGAHLITQPSWPHPARAPHHHLLQVPSALPCPSCTCRHEEDMPQQPCILTTAPCPPPPPPQARARPPTP